MIEMIGWVGSMMLAWCGLPQVIQTVRTKRADDVSALFLFLWYFGEIFTLIYTLTSFGWGPLIVNYLLNIVMISVIIYYKWRY